MKQQAIQRLPHLFVVKESPQKWRAFRTETGAKAFAMGEPYYRYIPAKGNLVVVKKP